MSGRGRGGRGRGGRSGHGRGRNPNAVPAAAPSFDKAEDITELNVSKEDMDVDQSKLPTAFKSALPYKKKINK